MLRPKGRLKYEQFDSLREEIACGRREARWLGADADFSDSATGDAR